MSRPRSLLLGLACLVALPWFPGCASPTHRATDLGANDAGSDSVSVKDTQTAIDRGPLPSLELRVDGRFDDWGDTKPLATDPAGDATGAFDVTRLYAASRGTELFLRFDIGDQPRNLAAGGPGEGDLIITLTLSEAREIRIALRGRRATVSAKQGTIVADWLDLAYRAAPVYAAREFELALDLATVGVAAGDRVQIALGGSDDVGPISLDLLPPPLPIPRRSVDRSPRTRLRVASQNTHFDGLMEPGKDARFGRLFKAVAADVYCLQELWKSTTQDIAQKLQSFDLHGDGLPWNVQRGNAYGDTMIASRWPLTPLPNTNFTWTAAGIMPPDGHPVVIVSIRLKCCGYLDSEEDRNRTAQVSAL
ncbi:MAG: hypothetical protein KAI47_27355, partial [Deltaproteobacteria bacterium]|nr:hypothetical protein [Deltaproteobacteria bacterium]